MMLSQRLSQSIIRMRGHVRGVTSHLKKFPINGSPLWMISKCTPLATPPPAAVGGMRHLSMQHGNDGGGRSWVDPRAQPEQDVLAKYTVDLTEAVENGKVDPIIGRFDEMRRTIEVLSRRTKNNPVLIGEPGVGKTAIAEGLAQRIAKGEVPDSIKGMRVLSLDLGAMIAGSSFRGEFEERMKSVLKAAEEKSDIILFVDEMHTLVGAGAERGALDASNMLKPALAKGHLKFVGATTLDEYRMYIEKDGALARRFQPVFVKEPTVEDTISIMRGLKEKYVIHHGVEIMDSAVVAAATYARRYMTDRKLPDKAIDLLDEAASRLRMQQESKPESIAALERKVITTRIEVEALKKESGAHSVARREKLDRRLVKLQAEVDRLTEQWQKEKTERNRRSNLQEDLEDARFELEDALKRGDFAKASELKYGTIVRLERELGNEDESGAPSSSNNESTTMLPEAVTEDDVAAVVARHTGIPVTKLLMSEKEKLLKMEDELEKRVVGQRHALEIISSCVRIARAGLHEHVKPIGSFLFLGPSGVGKTELAKALAEFMFDDADAMVRVDMSEYMEKFSVSRLIGAPPGYVGYDEGGVLTEAVRRRPFQVLLFDEAEKAHREVTNLLLQVLDEGFLTDSQGRKVDFRNTIIIMTSNLGAHASQQQIDAGILRADDTEGAYRNTMDAVKGHFPPEFINRLDNIIVFNRLGEEQMPRIVDIQLKRIERLLADKRIRLEVDDAVRQWLGNVGFDPTYGARPLKRAMERYVLDAMSTRILSGDMENGHVVRVQLNAQQDGLDFVTVGVVEAEAHGEGESDESDFDA